jgi:hypothetical protein
MIADWWIMVADFAVYKLQLQLFAGLACACSRQQWRCALVICRQMDGCSSAKTRDINRIAQQNYRRKKRNGYTANSGGRRGRPKCPGTWTTGGE